MTYCKVVNDTIYPPEPLPINYGNISNFYLLEEDIVNSYGFYRFLNLQEPEYNSNIQKLQKTLILKDNTVYYEYNVVNLTEEEYKDKLNKLKYFFTFLIENLLNTKVKERDYKDLLHACSYINSSIDQYKKEAEAVVVWRDAIWIKGYEIETKVLNNEIPIPTESEFLSQLPSLEWPL